MNLRQHWPLLALMMLFWPTGQQPTHAQTAVAPPAAKNAAPPAESALRFDPAAKDIDAAVQQLVGAMTLAEKIGQMSQVAPDGKTINDKLHNSLKSGEIG